MKPVITIYPLSSHSSHDFRSSVEDVWRNCFCRYNESQKGTKQHWTSTYIHYLDKKHWNFFFFL